MTSPESTKTNPLKDGVEEDLGFHSLEYGDYKVEFECISKQRGNQLP